MERSTVTAVLAVVGAICVLLVPTLLARELGERFDHSDALAFQIAASIESCEQQNEIRTVLVRQTRQSQDNLESLRHELFNISREEFDALVSERRQQAEDLIARLQPRDCNAEYRP